MIVLITGIFAIIVPNFGQFLSFIGSFAGSALVFIIPVRSMA